jgi:nucleotide-binding universal stress UspA family protein
VTAPAAVLAVALVALAVTFILRERARRSPNLTTASPTRVVFPFTGAVLSQRALDAALRLTRVDGATLVPVFLAEVPLHLPLDAALPRTCDSALPLLEAIEQRAARAGVAVDSRIERGRTIRHAIRQLVEHERFDTIVVTAGDAASPGFLPDEISWLLEHAPGEIIVIRPGTADLLLLTPPGRPRPARWRAAARRPGRGMPRMRTPEGDGRRG